MTQGAFMYLLIFDRRNYRACPYHTAGLWVKRMQQNSVAGIHVPSHSTAAKTSSVKSNYTWAVCITRKTILRLRVQGFYWKMVTQTQISQNLRNPRTPEEKQMFCALGRQNTLIWVSKISKTIISESRPGTNQSAELL